MLFNWSYLIARPPEDLLSQTREIDLSLPI